MDYHGKFFKYSIATFLILLNLFLFYQVSFLLKPLVDFVTILFIPVIISVVLYYLIRPFVQAMEKIKIPKPLSVLVLYLIIVLLLAHTSVTILPKLAQQMNDLIVQIPEKFDIVREQGARLLKEYDLDLGLEEFRHKGMNTIQNITKLFSENMLSFLALFTRLTTILFSVPFILFFLLKDDKKIGKALMDQVRGQFSAEVRKILTDIDHTLASYIIGQATIAASLGAMLFVGYSMIGLNFALLLSLVAVVLDFIPYVGAILTVIPALLVGFSTSWGMGAQVLIVFLVAQQMESQILYPWIIGKRLQISPLTVILLLIGAGSLYGLLGLILITPAYALCKVVFINLYKIYQIQRKLP